jgi:GNAT superfamily N-acetyltransferase
MTLSPRPLGPDDLDRVVAIDKAITGRSRRGFYQKRFAAMGRDPAPFIALGVVRGDALAGFVLAHVLDGEFGGRYPVAMLDAIGVAPDARGRGLGPVLMGGLDTALRARGVSELHSQANWSEHDLVRFFARAGFALAPRHILERPVDRAEGL